MILGIDLGSTRCTVAEVDRTGHPRVLADADGATGTPSAVRFTGPGHAEVGAAALADPERAVTLVRRRLGSEHPMEFHGVVQTPESVSALLLRARCDAVRAGRDGPVRAVLSVPGHAGPREREATAQAAELAGIEVLDLVADPVAVALARGADVPGPRTVLVHDLGGGMFDCAVLRIDDGAAVTVLAAGGDSALGGAEVTARLAGSLRARAEVTPQEALRAAERAVRALGTRDRVVATLRGNGRVTRVQVDRAMLDAACRDVLDATLPILDRVLAGAGARPEEVLLAGGASHLPAVVAALAGRLGVQPVVMGPDPVALGAALQAHRLATAPDTAARAVAGLPRAVGVLVRDSHGDPAGTRELVQQVLAADTPLPAAGTAPFATIRHHQRTVRIQVFEQVAGAAGSADPADHRRILDGEFRDLVERPAGSRIDVTVLIGGDGRLAVTGRDTRGRALTLDAYVEGVLDGAGAQRLAAGTRSMTIGAGP